MSIPDKCGPSYENEFQSNLTKENFTSYVNCKAFDVIGNGTYKSYLVKCRDNNDEWAVNMHQNSMSILENVRSITSLITNIRRLDASGVAVICREIITNTTPPVYSTPSWNVCQISDQHTFSCVEVIRSQHKNIRSVFIHSKYTTFLDILWFVCKIDHVVRNFTRQWLRSEQEKIKGMSLSETCEFFKTNTEEIDALFHVFSQSVTVLHNSMQQHLSKMTLCPSLQLRMQPKK